MRVPRSYGIVAVEEIALRAGIPVVFDILRHHCHDPEGIPDRKELAGVPPGRAGRG